MCAAEGKLVAAPSTANYLLVIDIETQEARGIPIGHGAGFDYGGICAYDGKVVLAPSGADHLLVFDVASEAVQLVDIRPWASGTCKFSGICTIGSTFLLLPNSESKLLVYSPAKLVVQIQIVESAEGLRVRCSNLSGSTLAEVVGDTMIVAELRLMLAEAVAANKRAIRLVLPNGVCLTDADDSTALADIQVT